MTKTLLQWGRSAVRPAGVHQPIIVQGLCHEKHPSVCYPSCPWTLCKSLWSNRLAMTVSVRELRSRLSEYLRRVEEGEELTITRLGRPVGRLVPTRANEERDAATVERLDRLPWIRPGRGGKPQGSRQPIPWKPGEKMLSEILVENRR
jgi:prevent-host-death family protein